MSLLPVVQCRDALLELIRKNQVLIVHGSTGSGKSTQIPRFLLDAGMATPTTKLCVTQPRRLAAIALAKRVAEESNCLVGTKVGYSVRFDDRSGPISAVKFCTDGMLLREILNSGIAEYRTVMLDETHERSVATDILLGLLRDVSRQDPQFRLIISSATLDTGRFVQFFGSETAVFEIPGRAFPVNTHFAAAASLVSDDIVDLVTQTVLQIHRNNESEGAILAFLPGQHEIVQCQVALENISTALGSEMAEIMVCCAYANLPDDQQARIFANTPLNCRKVVLATNIAETSITIPGVKYVVDSGLVKQMTHDPRTGVDSLQLTRCSRASAVQRTGRAGRLGPGECYRLYSKTQFDTEMPAQTEPEILRTNLTSICLLLMSLGVGSVLHFNWLDRPDNEMVIGALQQLYALGAVNAEAHLTKLGRLLAEFPVDPKLAKSLIMASRLGCVEEVCSIAAMLSELGNLYIRPKGRVEEANASHAALADSRGDHFTLLNIWRQWEGTGRARQWCRRHYIQYRSMQYAATVSVQLQNLVKRHTTKNEPLKSGGDLNAAIVKAIVSGYFLQSARLSKNRQNYITKTETVSIHPSSVLFGGTPEFVLYHELVRTTKEYMRGCLDVTNADEHELEELTALNLVPKT